MATKVKLIADDIISTDHLDPNASLTFADLTLTGNLTVQGTTTTLDTTNLNVEDKNITLNYGTGDTSSGVDGAGITIQDAVDGSNDATFNWGASNDRFKLSHGLEVLTGNVGIGTTSPTSKLTLSDTGSNSIVQTRFINDARNYALGVHGGLSDSFLLYDETAGATRLLVNASGYVGIGTTSPNHMLHLKQNANTGINIQVDNTSSTSYIDFGDSADDNIGNIEYIHSSDTMNFKTNATTRLSIDSSGDVLIGSATNLDVLSGTPKIQVGDGSGHASIQWYSGTGSVAGLYFGDASAGSARYEGYIEYRHNNNQMAFRTQGSDRLIIDSSGNVGIGATPSHNLHVKDSASHATARIEGASNSYKGTLLLSSASSGDGGIQYDANVNKFHQFSYGDMSFYSGTGNISGSYPNNIKYIIGNNGKHTFYGTHQGDSVGHFLFTNDGYDNSGVNCSLVVQNSHTFLQIMAWAHLGCRIGTRTAGYSTTGNQTTHLVSADATFIYGSSNGTAYLGSGTAITSDERLKKNIVSTPDGQLAKINALRPVSFDWKNETRESGEGFIAQEVEAIIPEAVAESTFAPDPNDDTRDFEGDVKSIKDAVLLSRLVKAVQELSTELDAAKARITELEG